MNMFRSERNLFALMHQLEYHNVADNVVGSFPTYYRNPVQFEPLPFPVLPRRWILTIRAEVDFF